MVFSTMVTRQKTAQGGNERTSCTITEMFKLLTHHKQNFKYMKLLHRAGKAAGPDGVSPRDLKACAPPPQLSGVFTMSAALA